MFLQSINQSRFNVRFLIKKAMSGTSLMAYEDTSRSTQVRSANSFTIEKGHNTCMVKNPVRQPDHFKIYGEKLGLELAAK